MVLFINGEDRGEHALTAWTGGAEVCDGECHGQMNSGGVSGGRVAEAQEKKQLICQN